MGFKKLRGIPLPEAKQGLIHYTCLTAEEQPRRTQEKIQRLCSECGGAYGAALRDVMCTQKSIAAIAMEYNVSDSVLYRARKLFYERW